MTIERDKSLTAWETFVLRHHKPSNLALHFVSMVLFFGSPTYGLLTGDAWWFVWWCISGIIGSGAHYVTRDGTVTLHEATSSPAIVFFNLRMWWCVMTRRYYSVDLARAKAHLRELTREAGRAVLITGCSSGFGRAMVPQFLAQGYHVIAHVRSGHDAEDLQQKHGVDADLTVIQADLRQAEQRDELVRRVQAGARLDALITNAGLGTFGALEDLSEADLREAMEVNFFGTALLARALTPLLRKAHGKLVCVSSAAGISGFPYTSVYCASKHAVAGLAESLYYELAPHGVKVHLLTPSAHRTDFIRNATWRAPVSSVYAKFVHGYRVVVERNQARELPVARALAKVAAELVERAGYGFRVEVGANVRILRFRGRCTQLFELRTR